MENYFDSNIGNYRVEDCKPQNTILGCFDADYGDEILIATAFAVIYGERWCEECILVSVAYIGFGRGIIIL